MKHLRYSANTGFLFPNHSILEKPRLAYAHGFDGIEFHDEWRSVDRKKLKSELDASGLHLCGLNTRMGPTAGCAALSSQVDTARRDIREASQAAVELGAASIHVLSGKGHKDNARETYETNLRFALDFFPRDVLVEPICNQAIPGYYLSSLEQAVDIVSSIGHPRLKIMYDLFHIHMMGHDVLKAFSETCEHVGHVQIASVPDRSEPDRGSPNMLKAAKSIFEAGYAGYLGCEYRPSGKDLFDWLDDQNSGTARSLSQLTSVFLVQYKSI